MGFRKLDFQTRVQFNSASSSEFVSAYEAFVEEKIRSEIAKPRSQAFAPSGFRCARQQWFRLRGVAPDKPQRVDLPQQHKADMGTACHRIIQTNLVEMLGEDWISVEDYLKLHPIKYRYELEQDGLETKVSLPDIPIKFACDGIIKWKGKYYLLEIKSVETDTFSQLKDIRPQNKEQIQCYCAALNISDVLVMYIDRGFGTIKVYEHSFSISDINYVHSKIENIKTMVAQNIAPDKLPPGDSWCINCSYKEKCKLW